MIRALFLLVCLAVTAVRAESVTALVAASTEDAVQEIASQFQTETGIEVNISAGGSNALAQQIIHGAPADVFLSASPQWTEAVDREGMIAETCELLGNELVIVQPRDAPPMTSPDDLLRAEVKFVALAGENVPAGVYAKQALTFHKVYEPLVSAKKIVRGQDVRSALAYVVRGEADAAVVYATDAKVAAKDIHIAFRFNADAHERIICPLALLASAKGNAAARRFYEHLCSAAAAEAFRQHGFIPLLPKQ